jgi:cell division septation protein DedD
LLLVALLALTAWASPLIGTTNSLAQDTPTVGVDADPTDNDAASLGTIDSCVSVSRGDTFQVDIFVADITNLLAWEAHFRYDPSLVTIVDRDVRMFLAASDGSDIYDASDPLPDSSGRYRLGAADFAIPRSPESGSGVLVRLTLEAVASGISPAEIAQVDRDGNGIIDLGTILSDELLTPISPSDSAGFFVGPIVNASIAVDSPCSAVTPVPTTPTPVPATPPPAESPTPQSTPALTSSPSATAQTPSPTTTPVATRTATPTTTATSTATPIINRPNGDGNDPPWVIIALAAGLGGAVVLAGGAILVRARRGGAG